MRLFEITQKEIEKIARDAGISSDLLDKRLDQESNKQHYDKTGKVKIGDKHMTQKAHGIGQVRQPALDDINADYGTNYTIKDLQNPAKNAKISALYLKLAKEKYASKFAPGKDAEAYANLAYQYGPDVPPDLVKNLPASGSKKPLYNPIKAKSTMPTQGQGMGAKDAYDQTMADPAVKQKIDTMKQAGSNLYQMGKDLIGGKTTLSKATDFENLTGKLDGVSGKALKGIKKAATLVRFSKTQKELDETGKMVAKPIYFSVFHLEDILARRVEEAV